MKQRQSYRREMEHVLGWYSVQSDVVLAHPRDLGAAFENAVAIHESMHKLLTLGSIYGAFERGMVAMAEDLPEAHIIHEVPASLIELAWATHEGTASYIELCFCALNGIDPRQHMQSFPADYAEAVAPIVAAIGVPAGPEASYQWLLAIHLAKLAMNGPVIEELGTPAKLTKTRLAEFARKHAPDLRFREMWRIVKQRGGLASVLRPYSEEMVKEWRRNRSGPPPMTRWKSSEIFDVREAERRSADRPIADHAEQAHWKIAAALFPSIPMISTAEGIQEALRSFVVAWSEVSPAAAKLAGNDIPMIPSEESQLGRRRYAVRTRLHARLPEKGLDDLREFLSAQAGKRRTTLASFIETTSGQIGVWAVGTDGLGGEIRVRDAWVAAIPVLEVMDIITLQLETEPYGRSTLWHLPIDLTNKFDIYNIGLGLHGVVLRSLPFFSEKLLLDQAKEWLDDGRAVRILPVTLKDLHVQAILIEAHGGHGPYSLRSANLPTYCACLGNAREGWQIFTKLGGVEEEPEPRGLRRLFGRKKEPALRYAGDVDAKEADSLLVLLHMAYNLDVLARGLTPGLQFVRAEVGE